MLQPKLMVVVVYCVVYYESLVHVTSINPSELESFSSMI
jgi:hypothetical protein